MGTLTGNLSSPVRASELARHLREQINAGRFEPGERLPTFSQIHRNYGAATNTVDRAYSLLETDGLIERRPGSGVYVAEHAGMITTGTIGCLGAGFKGIDPYWAHCMRGINQTLESRDTHPLLLPPDPKEAAWDKIDGLLCQGTARVPAGCPAELPRVSLLRCMPGAVSVVTDDYGGARAATKHLLDIGHRRIATLFIQDDELGVARLGGYEAALRLRGIQPSPGWSRNCTGDFNSCDFAHVAETIMCRWLRNGWKELHFTALLAQNDHVAIGAMNALNEAGVRVPDDVSVVGFDGTRVAEHCRPRLTTMKVPLERIGHRAACELIRQIEDGTRTDEETIQLPVALLERDSTAPPAG